MLDSSNNRNVLSYNSGALKSEIRELAGLFPSEGCEENISSVSFLVSDDLLAISGISSQGDLSP